MKNQSGTGWKQTIQTQSGGAILRPSKQILLTGKQKTIRKRKHKEADHPILGRGYIPEDLKLPDDPLKIVTVNKTPHQYYLVPNKQVGGFLPFLAALIPAAIKAATIGGATALGGLAVSKLA
jgi:hypothetical protein